MIVRCAHGLLGLLLLASVGCVPSTSAGLLTPEARHIDPAGKSSEKTLAPVDTAQLCLKLGEKMEQTGHWAEAILQYERARQNDPKLPLTHRLAILHGQAGQDDQAVAEFTKALEANPKNADIHNDLGYHHYNCGRWADAEKCLHQATALNAKHPRAWINLGLTLGQQQRYDESLEAFQKSVRPAEAQCNLAFILATQGKSAEAAQAYRRALELDPNHRLAAAALDRLENGPQHAGPAGKEAALPGSGASMSN